MPEVLDPWPCGICLAARRKYSKIVGAEPVLFMYMFGTLLYLSQFKQYLLWRYGNENIDYPFSKTGEHYCINFWEDRDNYTNASSPSADLEAQLSANRLNMFTQIVALLPSIIGALLLGPLSDRYGRKLPMLLVGCGTTLAAIMVVVIMFFNLSVYLFFLSSALIGLSGGLATMNMACYSYTAEVSSVKSRTLRFGLLQATVYIAGALAQGHGRREDGGLWLQNNNCHFVPPMCAYAAANFLIVLYVVLILPESSSRQERMARARTRMRGLKALLQGFKIFFCGHRINYSLRKLWCAMIAVFLVMANTVGSTYVIFFFLKERLDFDARQFGFYWLSTQIFSTISLIVIMPLMIWFRMPDPSIALIGVVIGAAMNIFTGFVQGLWEMFFSKFNECESHFDLNSAYSQCRVGNGVIFDLNSAYSQCRVGNGVILILILPTVCAIQGMQAVVVPSLRSLLSKLVRREDQGALFSLVATVQLFSSTIITELVFYVIYSMTLNWNAGMTFYLIAILFIIPAVLIMFLLNSHEQNNSLVVEIESPATDPAPPEEEKSLLGDSSYNSNYGTCDT